MQKVVLATGNAGKVRELASLLSDFGLDIVAQTVTSDGYSSGQRLVVTDYSHHL